MSNRFIPLTSGTDMNQVLSILNKNFGELDSEANIKVFNAAGGKPGFIEGILPNKLGYGFLLYDDDKVSIACYVDADGKPVLKVAKDGFDATTADDNQLIFNSSQDVFKVVKTATVTIPGTGNQAPFSTGATGITIPHSLGYVPAYLVYAVLPVVPVSGLPTVTSWNQMLPAVGADSNQMTYNVQAGTDSNNLYLVDFWANNSNSTPVQPIQATYYLFTTNA